MTSRIAAAWLLPDAFEFASGSFDPTEPPTTEAHVVSMVAASVAAGPAARLQRLRISRDLLIGELSNGNRVGNAVEAAAQALCAAAAHVQRSRWTCELLAKVAPALIQEAAVKAATELTVGYDQLLRAGTAPGASEFISALEMYLAKNGNKVNKAGRGVTSALQSWRDSLLRSGCGTGTNNTASADRVNCINEELSELCGEFNKGINSDVSSVVLSKEALRGVPDATLSGLATTDDGESYRVTMKYPDALPVLRLCDVPESREKVLRCFKNRATPENLDILSRILQLRTERAQLLGFASHSHTVLNTTRLIGSPENAVAFLSQLRTAFGPIGERELDELKALNARDLKPWDISYFTEKYRQKNYGIDTELLREYFPIEHVRDSVFAIYQNLFGIEIVAATTVVGWPVSATTSSNHPDTGEEALLVWHEDVMAFRVYSTADNGKRERVGTFFLDLFPRPGKYGHACAYPVVDGILADDGITWLVRPVACMVANFPADTPQRPSCLSHREVETFFHEFGHVVHNLCGRAQSEPETWFNCAFDFIESPSQMLEHWTWQPSILKFLSKHYKSGVPLDDETIARLVASRSCLIGQAVLRQIGMALFDIRVHGAEGLGSLPESGEGIAQMLSRSVANATGLPELDGNHEVASFQHLCSGYDSSYYCYLLSETIAADLWETGFGDDKAALSSEHGRAYRDAILEPAASIPAADLVREFLGREPNQDAFMRVYGLL